MPGISSDLISYKKKQTHITSKVSYRLVARLYLYFVTTVLEHKA